MLQSLEVRNYRNLRHLTIPKLGRVNLLVGKNNTGKTSVLEAAHLLVNRGRYDLIYNILGMRGGLFESSEDRYQNNKNILTSLFTNRRIKPDKEGDIIITDSVSKILRLGFSIIDSSGNNIPELVGFTIYHTDFQRLVWILIHQSINPTDPAFPPFDWPKSTKNQFVKADGIALTGNGELYDNIVTTDAESSIIEALKIINQDIERIAFRTDSSSLFRYPIARLKNNLPIPLQSMGDGINRILTIILAMVNCENGYLLIDEFENGLHYSVQEKLWEVIFHLSQRLNIQVFATTHSSDAIHAFTHVANAKPENKDAQLIKLRNAKGEISAVTFNADELLLADKAEYIEFR